MKAGFSQLGLNVEFASLTLLAIIANIPKFRNSISFALKNDISMSLKLGSSSALQTALVQMPIYVGMAAILFHLVGKQTYTFILPRLHIFGIWFSVLILNYLTIDGRTNYLEGVALLIVYVVMITAIYFVYYSF